MTDGSSQGLFVIVAVVIFGIFVSISYIIFQENLSTSLASIFKESTVQSKESLYQFKNIKKSSGYYAKVSLTDKGIWDVYDLSPRENLIEERPSGLQIVDKIEVPYNHKIIFQFDILVESPHNYTLSVDMNSTPSGATWKGNDNYGTTLFSPLGKMFNWEVLEGNKWYTRSFWYVNDNSLNKNKVSIYEDGVFGTIIGIQGTDVNSKNIKTMKIKNLKYKVVPFEGGV